MLNLQVTVAFLSAFSLIILSSISQAHTPHELGLHGDLRLISKNALNQPKALEEFDKSEHLYGIGMPEGLDQEVIVIAGKAYSGYYVDSTYVAREIASSDLVFFVSSHIPDWMTLSLPEDVKTFDEFENYLKRIATDYGLNTTEGFMFRLQAEVQGLRWFIVGGIGNEAPNALSSFLRNRTMGGLENRTIDAIGTYSESLKGIASVPNSALHMHFITIDDKKLFVGHVDNELLFGDKATLYLPVQD